MKFKRWYDKHKRLSHYLNHFKTMNPSLRDRFIKDIADILNGKDKLDLTEIFNFPLDLPKRRWYDKDPYLWLVFNGIRISDDETVREIEDYLEEAIDGKGVESEPLYFEDKSC